jgi:hypothetical protein
MSDLLATGESWLAGKLGDEASTAVAVTVGNTTGTIYATIGKTVFEAKDDKGFVTSYESRDYEFDAAVFVATFGDITPSEGITVVETEGAKVYTYIVGSPKGKRCWEYVGTARDRIKVHTKFYGIT